MDESVRHLVQTRAGNRCEYCRLPQDEGSGLRFHIEHIRPQQHGGRTETQNLALACPNCNWNKGSNLAAIDPATDELVPLFNPRTDAWSDHFAFSDLQIVGTTATGRAAARLLKMNAPARIHARHAVKLRGEQENDAL